jgi:hypothetical protein
MGNVGNRIIGIQGSGNGADAVDGNPGCSTNLWTANQFAIASQGCIH